MKLNSFLLLLRGLKDKHKLLWLHMLTESNFRKSISIKELQTITSLSRPTIYTVIRSINRPIIIDSKKLTISIEKAHVNFKLTKIINTKTATAEQLIQIKYIIEALNTATGKAFNPETASAKKVILDRLKEGYSQHDFETVIRKQAMKWLGTDSEIYLRPETIFGEKMDGYLNAPEPTHKKNTNKLQNISDAINEAKQFDWGNISKS